MKIDPQIFVARFPERCRLELCRSRCCRFGVWADLEEQKKILDNRDLVLPFLRDETKDASTWFGKTEEDSDCPSGLAVETQAVGGYCAFFNPACGCALQKGAGEAGLHEWELKPRFCIMFPLVVSEGELTVDEDMKTLWCMKEPNRTHPILFSVKKEVSFLFGERTARELHRRLEASPANGGSSAGRRA